MRQKNNKELIELIKVRLTYFKDLIEKMSQDEIKTEKTDKILEIVKFLILIKEFKNNKVQV